MPHSTTCLCGQTLTAQDLDALVPVAHDHFTREHPEYGLQEFHIRDYLETEQRQTGATDRREVIGPVHVRSVGPQDLEDLLQFFDHEAFADNPAWGACYCMCHHIGNGTPAWQNRTSRDNRADLIARVRAGTTTGIGAWVDGHLGGWCNASPRDTFADWRGRDDDPDDTIGSIACFVIAPPYRRHGLARRLLDEACAVFAARGLALAEAYPRTAPEGDAGAYHGPLALYLDAGFELVEEQDGVAVVRKPLQGSLPGG